MIRFQERSSPRDTSGNRSHDCGISEDSSRKRFASSDRTGHRRRFSSGDSPSPMRLEIVHATAGDSLQEIPLLLYVGVRPVPPLMMNTLGNPHHSLLLEYPHHGLLGNLHHSLLVGNPRRGLLLGNPHHGLLLPPFGRWWISFSRLFLIIRLLLPIHRRDYSIFYYYGCC